MAKQPQIEDLTEEITATKFEILEPIVQPKETSIEFAKPIMEPIQTTPIEVEGQTIFDETVEESTIDIVVEAKPGLQLRDFEDLPVERTEIEEVLELDELLDDWSESTVESEVDEDDLANIFEFQLEDDEPLNYESFVAEFETDEILFSAEVEEIEELLTDLGEETRELIEVQSEELVSLIEQVTVENQDALVIDSKIEAIESSIEEILDLMEIDYSPEDIKKLIKIMTSSDFKQHLTELASTLPAEDGTHEYKSANYYLAWIIWQLDSRRHSHIFKLGRWALSLA